MTLDIFKRFGAIVWLIFTATFIFALHTALPLYANSSFLSKLIPENTIGFIYTLSSLITIGVIWKFPQLLARFGNYAVTALFSILEIGFLLILAFGQTPLALIAAFVASQVLIALLAFNLDVFLEAFSSDKETGILRGIMLSAYNVAILAGPLVAGLILTNGDFWKIYLAAALLMVPVAGIALSKFRNFKDPEYSTITPLKTLYAIVVKKHPNDHVRHAIVATFLLNLFYSWMVIYTPIYLYNHIGFSWEEIGVIFFVMLLPFVIFELPIGKFIDKTGLERSVMVGGFLLLIAFTGSLFFITEPTVWLWAALLFGTRTGASIIEITTESYFFKHINKRDTNVLGVFRNTRSLAFIVGPLLGSLLLVFIPMQSLFLVLASIMTLGLVNGYLMQDGKKYKQNF